MAYITYSERHQESEYAHIEMRLVEQDGASYMEPYIVETGRPVACRRWTVGESVDNCAEIKLTIFSPKVLVVAKSD